jgi:hypothetical protein
VCTESVYVSVRYKKFATEADIEAMCVCVCVGGGGGEIFPVRILYEVLREGKEEKDAAYTAESLRSTDVCRGARTRGRQANSAQEWNTNMAATPEVFTVLLMKTADF